jgi:hypothetical protein
MYYTQERTSTTCLVDEHVLNGREARTHAEPKKRDADIAFLLRLLTFLRRSSLGDREAGNARRVVFIDR